MDSPFVTNSEGRSLRARTRAFRGATRGRHTRALVATALALATLAPACDEGGAPTTRPEAVEEQARVGPEALSAQLAEIRRGGDDLERLQALAALVRRVDARSAALLRSEVIDRSSTWRPFDRLILLAAWASFAGEEATRWAAFAAPKAYRAIALELAMASWARSDGEAALAALNRDFATDRAAMAGLVAGWLESDPDRVRAFVERLDLAADTGQSGVAVYVRRLIERDGTHAATAWAEERGAAWNFRRTRHLYRQVASELTMFDPAAGVAFCERHCEGASGGAVRQMVATRWSMRDPAATMAWLLTNDEADPDERKYAVNAAYANWMRMAPRAAVDWALAQDPALRAATWFEPVVRRVARALDWQRAEEALAWTEAISRVSERERAQVFILKRWRARDEAGAEAWLASSALSEAARKEIRSAGEADRGA